MKKSNTSIGAAVIAALALPVSGSAADSHQCSAIFNNARRLACYDDAFGKPVRPAATVPATPAAAPAKPAGAKNESVSAKIVAVGQLPNDRFSVTLDNGQLWVQLERDVGAEVRVGDTVTIRPAMLGSWMLETGAGVRTRVRLSR